MPIPALMNLAALLILIVLPGLLLHQLVLKRVNLSWRVGVILLLALQTVLFSDLASLFRYSLPLMLSISLITLLVLAAIWLNKRRKHRLFPSLHTGEGVGG